MEGINLRYSINSAYANNTMYPQYNYYMLTKFSKNVTTTTRKRGRSKILQEEGVTSTKIQR
jgi:hypothetical protein